MHYVKHGASPGCIGMPEEPDIEKPSVDGRSLPVNGFPGLKTISRGVVGRLCPSAICVSRSRIHVSPLAYEAGDSAFVIRRQVHWALANAGCRHQNLTCPYLI